MFRRMPATFICVSVFFILTRVLSVCLACSLPLVMSHALLRGVDDLSFFFSRDDRGKEPCPARLFQDTLFIQSSLHNYTHTRTNA
uniref:Putative secreted peptide n=1 Tax=Anopheles braziliensis TaxID=58242 RepID=A0A2M3ZQF5_9DIPT